MLKSYVLTDIEYSSRGYMSTLKPRHFRVFLASPGDVSHERELALMILDRLPYEPALRGRITIEEVAWDKKGAGAPIVANLTPQDSIQKGLPLPSQCDIVVVIFWSRMGTPLPIEYVKKDGSRYSSGTEWEYEEAIEGSEKNGSPQVLLYRRTESILLDPEDPRFEEKTNQYRLVKTFFENLRNPDGSIKRGYNTYVTVAEFSETLEFHLKSLIERFLREEPKITEVVGPDLVPQPWPGSPFPGLRAFGVKDAPIFFGRERETDALIQRVEENRVIAVVGSSGSGKSSLVGAGLIPRLLLTTGNEGWRSVRTTPDFLGSGDPFAALAASLLRDLPMDESQLATSLLSHPEYLSKFCLAALGVDESEKRLLLFIDQFEELFTTVRDQYRQPFVEMLVATANQPRICTVITLRGDFYGKCVELPQLARLLERSTYPLSVPGIASLHDMIIRPASRADLEFEEGLVQRILNDTGDEPGSLALMAYTLDELYRVSAGTKKLTHLAYEELGGVQGAIGKRSEAIFALLGPGEQQALPHVFRELVEVDERGTATRKREHLTQVARTQEARKLVEAFTNARLLVMSNDERNRPFVEVAHEALLRSWERLAEWIKETQEDLRLLRQVRIAAQDWDHNGKRDDFLWSQERLEPVYAMRERLQVDFDQLVLDFVRPEVDRLFDEFRLNHQYFRQRPIIERFAEIGESSVPSLVKALRYASAKSAKRDIHQVLDKYRERSLSFLKSNARVAEVQTRRAVTEELCRMQEPSTVGELTRLLSDVDSKVRILAVMALGSIKDPTSLPALSEVLEDPDVNVGKVACVEIASFGTKEVSDILLRVLSDRNSLLRPLCAYLLGVLANPMADSNWYSYRPALRDLELPYDDYGWDLLTDAVYQSRGKLSNILPTTHAPALLMDCLDDQNASVRHRTATAVGLIAPDQAISSLFPLLADDDSQVRGAAMDALERVYLGTLLTILLKGLESRFDDVRSWSADLLGKLGEQIVTAKDSTTNPETLATLSDLSASLLSALRDSEIRVRRSAARALGLVRNAEAIPVLLQSLQDKDPILRAHSASALGLIGNRKTVAPLRSLLNDPEHSVKQAAVIALGAIGDASAIPSLLEIVPAKDGNSLNYYERGLKLTLIQTLGKLGGDDVVPLLEESLHIEDYKIKQAAISSLKKIDTESAREALLNAGIIVLPKDNR